MNSQTPGGVTPLHRAAYCGHEGVVKELIKNHADVRIVDSDGRTALHKVVRLKWSLQITDKLGPLKLSFTERSEVI